ncbi:MAG: uroporphyrinogen decarboxylase [Rhodospirillaceae bacterium]|nr:uroporphyrinogen decarboxylase [Rhodospirillaceae bacterium]
MLAVLEGEAANPPPVWLMRQAGRYLPEYREVRAKAGSFLDLCFTPALAAEVTVQPIRRFGFDAAILFSDILTVPWALDRGVRFVAGEGPRLDPLEGFAKLPEMNAKAVAERLSAVYEAATLARLALTEDVPLIGFAGAPWTVACYMVEGGGSRDFAAVRRQAFADPKGFAALIDGLVAVTVEHLGRQVEAGAAAVQLFDSWAGVLAPSAFRRWVIEPTRAIVRGLRKRCGKGLPVIGFPRGGGVLIPEYVAATGVDAVGLDTAVPVDWARIAIPATTAVQGNLDPMALLAGGKALDAEVDAILNGFAGRPFVFNLGHGIVPETPIAHVEALVARVRRSAAAR